MPTQSDLSTQSAGIRFDRANLASFRGSGGVDLAGNVSDVFTVLVVEGMGCVGCGLVPAPALGLLGICRVDREGNRLGVVRPYRVHRGAVAEQAVTGHPGNAGTVHGRPRRRAVEIRDQQISFARCRGAVEPDRRQVRSRTAGAVIAGRADPVYVDAEIARGVVTCPPGFKVLLR